MTKLRVIAIGLSLSSSWGNGHATTYRALLKAFAARGHDVMFLERDVPWYAAHRDLVDPDFCHLAFYRSFQDLKRFHEAVAGADAVMVGSYVPEGVAVGQWVQSTTHGVSAFYDIDTPVTLASLERGENDYLSADLIAGYHVYFSFTGGPILDLLMKRYRSPMAKALYCSVDPQAYAPLPCQKRWDLTYLGTYSPDRQPALERLLITPARRAPHLRFAVAGSQYPSGIAWPDNIERIEHVPPQNHPLFYAQSRFTLNITRADMIRAGYSPSVRLFEAAACATPIISDMWDGIDTFFLPNREIVLAQNDKDVLHVLQAWPEERRRALAHAARRRVLAEHTASHRAVILENSLIEALRRRREEHPLALEARP